MVSEGKPEWLPEERKGACEWDRRARPRRAVRRVEGTPPCCGGVSSRDQVVRRSFRAAEVRSTTGEQTAASQHRVADHDRVPATTHSETRRAGRWAGSSSRWCPGEGEAGCEAGCEAGEAGCEAGRDDLE